jgi:hypothetical protein
LLTCPRIAQVAPGAGRQQNATAPTTLPRPALLARRDRGQALFGNSKQPVMAAVCGTGKRPGAPGPTGRLRLPVAHQANFSVVTRSRFAC